MTRDERFAELLSRVARAVTRRQASDVCCGTFTLEQFRTLRAVAGSETEAEADAKPTIGSLSSALGVDLSTMSRNVTVLEREGHLARARGDDDGRLVHVRLTPKGRRALETLRCGERDVLSDVYARLPAADRPKVLEALEALDAGLAADDESAGEPVQVYMQIRTRGSAP